jgi:hypothetical protein
MDNFGLRFFFVSGMPGPQMVVLCTTHSILWFSVMHTMIFYFCLHHTATHKKTSLLSFGHGLFRVERGRSKRELTCGSDFAKVKEVLLCAIVWWRHKHKIVVCITQNQRMECSVDKSTICGTVWWRHKHKIVMCITQNQRMECSVDKSTIWECATDKKNPLRL